MTLQCRWAAPATRTPLRATASSPPASSGTSRCAAAGRLVARLQVLSPACGLLCGVDTPAAAGLPGPHLINSRPLVHSAVAYRSTAVDRHRKCSLLAFQQPSPKHSMWGALHLLP